MNISLQVLLLFTIFGVFNSTVRLVLVSIQDAPFCVSDRVKVSVHLNIYFKEPLFSGELCQSDLIQRNESRCVCVRVQSKAAFTQQASAPKSKGLAQIWGFCGSLNGSTLIFLPSAKKKKKKISATSKRRIGLISDCFQSQNNQILFLYLIIHSCETNVIINMSKIRNSTLTIRNYTTSSFKIFDLVV